MLPFTTEVTEVHGILCARCDLCGELSEEGGCRHLSAFSATSRHACCSRTTACASGRWISRRARGRTSTGTISTTSWCRSRATASPAARARHRRRVSRLHRGRGRARQDALHRARRHRDRDQHRPAPLPRDSDRAEVDRRAAPRRHPAPPRRRARRQDRLRHRRRPGDVRRVPRALESARPRAGAAAGSAAAIGSP